MAVEMRVQVVNRLPALQCSRSDGAGIKDSLVSVVNGSLIPVSVSGLDGFSRLESPVILSSNRRRCLYIGNSLYRRKKFDVYAISRSGRNDAVRLKAERDVAELIDRSDKLKEEYKRLSKRSTPSNDKRMQEILATTARRLQQALKLQLQLTSSMSKEINLKTLIEVYESFTVGMSRTARALGQATSLARS